MNDKPDSPPEPSGNALLRLVGPLLLVLLGIAWWRGLPAARGSADPVPTPPNADGLVVYVETAGLETPVPTAETPWREGLTVRDATEAAAPSVWRDEGSLAFLDEIHGVPHQADKGLFWQFEVNNVYSQRGAGDFRLSPGDRVLWKLAPYE